MPMPSSGDAMRAFSRRALLRGGLGGVALLGLGSLGLSLQPTRRGAAPSEPLRALTPDEHAVLEAVAARVCPAPAPDVPGPAALAVALQADRMFEHAHPEALDGLKTALKLLESPLVGALTLGHVRPFTQLEPAQQDAVLLAWRDSSVAVRRSVFRALSALVASLYYGDRRTWPGVGYPGPPSASALRVAYAENLVDQRALLAPGAEDA